MQCPACKEPTVEGGRIANSKGKCYFKPDNSKLIEFHQDLVRQGIPWCFFIFHEFRFIICIHSIRLRNIMSNLRLQAKLSIWALYPTSTNRELRIEKRLKTRFY